MIRGTIVEVALRPAGGELVGDHASGSSTLTVYDTFGFNPSGGTLSVDGATYAYTSLDDDTGVLNLSGVTSAAYDDGERVVILPARTEKIATVVIDGQDGSVPARILHVLEPFLAEGVRAPGDQEYALLLTDGDEYLVLDTPGKIPVIDPESIGASGDSVFIAGPPQYYCDDPQGNTELIAAGDMVGLVDPGWLAAMNSLTFVNGNLSFGNITNGVFEDYYPCWVVPASGPTARARIESVDVSDLGPDIENYTLGLKVSFSSQDASLSGDALTVQTFYIDQFEYAYECDPAYGGPAPIEAAWEEYTDYFPDSKVGDFQSEPLISATSQEAATVGGVDQALDNPFVVVTVFPPVPDPGDDEYQINIHGLRVDFE